MKAIYKILRDLSFRMTLQGPQDGVAEPFELGD